MWWTAVAAAVCVLCASVSDADARRRRSQPVKRVEDITPDGRPNVQSKAAYVVDLDSGEVLFQRADQVALPIASVSKLFLALVVRDKGIVLDQTTTITEEDRRYAARGARSKLMVGSAYRNDDLLRAMLVASDNRACPALGRAVGLSPEALGAAMTAKARSLGALSASFTDPSGLHGNVATARDVAVALVAVLKDPVLARMMAQPYCDITAVGGRTVRHQNTNRLLKWSTDGGKILGGKTGYTDAARYCLAIAGEVKDRRVGMVFLGAEGKLTRFADYRRVVKWLVARR